MQKEVIRNIKHGLGNKRKIALFKLIAVLLPCNLRELYTIGRSEIRIGGYKINLIIFEAVFRWGLFES